MVLRRLSTVLLVAVALVGAACTADGEQPPPADDGQTPEPTVDHSPLPTRDTGAVEFEEGVFRYEFNFVTAELRWSGGEGELAVDNRSQRELGPPGLYAVTSDQREVPAEVGDAATIEPGDSASFTVTFPPDLDFDQTGFVVLLFGEQNWGAFAPVPVDEA